MTLNTRTVRTQNMMQAVYRLRIHELQVCTEIMGSSLETIILRMNKRIDIHENKADEVAELIALQNDRHDWWRVI